LQTLLARGFDIAEQRLHASGVRARFTVVGILILALPLTAAAAPARHARAVPFVTVAAGAYHLVKVERRHLRNVTRLVVSGVILE